MLETLREYGLERLRESGEALASQRAHAFYYLALAEEAEQHLKGAQQVLWGKRLEQELGNLRTAMTWLIESQEGELALRLGGALSLFWYRRGYWSEGWHWLEAALGLPQAQGRTASRAEALLGAADFATYCGGKSRAYALLEESVAISRQLGDKRGLATSLGGFGSLQNEAEAACSLLEESLTLAREVGDPWILANALIHLGVFMQEQGDLKQARLYLEESVMLYRTLKDQHALSYSLCKLIEVALSESQVMQAATLAQENLALARELNNGPDVTRVLYWAAVTQALQGDTGQAAGLLEECLAQAREQDDKSQICSALLLLGRIVLYQGNLLRAEMCLQESLTLSREFCIESQMGVTLSLLGEIGLLQGNLTQARDLCREAVSLSWEREQWYSLGVSLIALAKVTAADGKPEQTARLFGVAEPCLNPRTDLDPFKQKEYERAVEGARVQLGEKVFADLWAEGKVMTREQVLAAVEPGIVATTNPTESSSTLPGKAATPYPNDLTTREMDVLRLLAQGLTSSQIAERLVIGLVTVNSHVRSIYSKLGVASRAAATRYALEHHLL
jgi:ATP/maltotriose-dependent transcriptional regulator MalT